MEHTTMYRVVDEQDVTYCSTPYYEVAKLLYNVVRSIGHVPAIITYESGNP